MPLESLSENQINIHDLTLEQEKQPMPKWREDYEALKLSGVYNNKEQLWQETTEDSSYHNAATQLLDVLIRLKLDQSAAHERYDWLKSRFYNDEKECWLDISDDYGPSANTEDQLIAILIEAQFDKEKVASLYEKLKHTSFHNSATDSWNGYQSQEASGEDNTTYSEPQILDIAIRAQFDESAARKDFNKLKNDRGYYDDEANQWKTYSWRKPYDDTRSSTTQLFAVLAESQFDKEAAKKFYESLKQSSLYDQDDQQWNDCISEGRLDEHRFTRVQLLGILCEQLFDESEPSLQKSPLSPPEQRSY